MAQRHPHKRSLLNFVLKPGYQLKHGFYFFMFMLGSSLIVQWLIFNSMRKAIAEFYVNHDVNAVAKWLDPSMTALDYEFAIAIVIFAVGALIFGIWVTHKIIGPTVAIKRLIKDLKNGDYGRRVILRKGDQLMDVADDLNELSAILRERHNERFENIHVLNKIETTEKNHEKKSA